MRKTQTESKRLPLGDVTLHYLDYGGHGPRGLILLHGGGANAHWFDRVGPIFARHCRVLALDLRGHGDSSPAEPPVYSFDAYVDDVRALLEAEHIAAPIIMGHSMGGTLAVKYTGTRPREVGALVVCDAMMVYSQEISDRLRRMGHRPGREYDTLEDYIAHFRILPDGLRAPKAVHDHIARTAGRQTAKGRWVHKLDRRIYAQRESIDTLPLWPRITCPVLILRAEYNPRFRPAILQQIKERCPQVESAEVAEAGHHLVLDQPGQTADLVLAFLRRHRLLHDSEVEGKNNR